MSTTTLRRDSIDTGSFLARSVLSRFAHIESGLLTVHEGGRRHSFGASDARVPDAELRVQDPRFWRAVALRGSVGAGEAYAQEWWNSADPTAVVRLFTRNRAALEGLESGWARLSRPVLGLYHRMRGNTEKGSRKNIASHYDLSNAFFQLFLDETMTYSCGIFDSPSTTMQEASKAKIDRICSLLKLTPKDHLLEIGTGWGALAVHAAKEYGCRVTTTTISREQHAVAAQRIREAGLESRVQLLQQDYRRLEGSFDKLVSVEMIEAVGHEYMDEFFAVCGARLRPGGSMCLQAITIADRYYDSARKCVDFIQRHIFPGSCIPSVTSLCSSATRATDLRLVQLDDIGRHYVRTLQEWGSALRSNWAKARGLGFTEQQLRMWEFYFCYCAGAFAERHISDVQMLFERPATSATSPNGSSRRL